MHLGELFIDLLKVVYKAARLPIQVPNINTRIQHFFENLSHNMLGVSMIDMIRKNDTDFYRFSLYLTGFGPKIGRPKSSMIRNVS